MLFLIQQRTLAGDGPEVLVKAGKVIESAFVAQLLDADPVVEEQLTGMSDTDLCEELGIGLSGPGFEIPAEGIGDKAGDGCYFFEIDLAGEILEGMIVDGIYPIVLLLGEFGSKADRRQQLEAAGGRKGRQAFDQGDDPAHAFYCLDIPDKLGDLFSFACAYQDTPPGFFQQAADGFCLREIEKGVAPEIL